MIFQEPMAVSVRSIPSAQIIEAIRLHRGMSHAEARAHAIEMLHRGRFRALPRASIAILSSSAAVYAPARHDRLRWSASPSS